MPSVDAMVVTDGKSLQLCLNEFSPRVSRLAKTNLCRRCSGAVVDPRQVISEGSSIGLYSEVSRRDEEVVLAELQRTTGVLFTALRPTRHSVSALVRHPTTDDTVE